MAMDGRSRGRWASRLFVVAHYRSSTSPTVDDDEARVEAGDWNLGVVGTAHSGALSRLGKTCTVVSTVVLSVTVHAVEWSRSSQSSYLINNPLHAVGRQVLRKSPSHDRHPSRVSTLPDYAMATNPAQSLQHISLLDWVVNKVTEAVTIAEENERSPSDRDDFEDNGSAIRLRVATTASCFPSLWVLQATENPLR